MLPCFRGVPIPASLQSFLDAAAQSSVPPIEELPLEDARKGATLFIEACAAEKQPVAHVEDRVVPGPAGDIPVRVYRPDADGPLPVVAYFHGGGWVFMGIETHDWICRRLANAAGAVVVSVEYRLAPEHPFPAPLDDCIAVTHWLAEHAAELDGDPARLAVAGDSAGGNLAAAVALASRADAGLRIAAQVLVYPVTDAACATPSFVQNADGYLLTAATMRWFWAQYLSGGGSPDDGYASVLRHPDLAGLPSTLVITAEFDPLCDEGEAYAEHLGEAGVDVTLRRYDGMVHGFVGMDALMPEADQAMAEIAEFLRQRLQKPG
jgi:acetyl esterase